MISFNFNQNVIAEAYCAYVLEKNREHLLV